MRSSEYLRHLASCSSGLMPSSMLDKAKAPAAELLGAKALWGGD
jgi:hypothetical protein